MGAYTTFTEVMEASGKLGGLFVCQLGNGSYGGQPPYTLWTRAQRRSNAFTYPTTPEALTSASGVALLDSSQLPTSITGKQLWALQLALSTNFANAYSTTGVPSGGSYLLLDRLSHMGGLSTTVTTEQTTNLPTAALTRYTDGEGVIAAVEGNGSLTSSSSVTCTIRYTNSTGTANRTSKELVIGSTSTDGGATTFRPFCLQDGDTGIRSIEGFTMTSSSGATAGSVGLILVKPLLHFAPCVGAGAERQGIRNLFHAGAIQEIKPGAALMLVMTRLGTSVTSAFQEIGSIVLGAK